jgi:ParB-like chromosome segregation protein Spo0J
MNTPDYKKDYPLQDLIPYARNSRTHSDEQVTQIASSIKEFGFTNPVLIDSDGGIIAGHGRVMAAKKLKMESVPVIVLSHLTEAQRRAYVIADNKLALNAGWDDEMLRVEFQELQDLGFDVELTGFSVQEMANLFDQQEHEKELVEQRYAEVFQIIIECDDEQEQERVFNKLDTEGYKCRVQSL